MLGLGPLALAALAGCTSPNPNYYRIGAVPGPALTGGPPRLEVRSISIPGYLDRQGIVKKAIGYQLDIHQNDLWAEPLAQMLEAAMVEDLTARLPGTTVLGAGGSIGPSADLLLETNVLRFDPDPNGQMVLTLQVGLRDGVSLALLATRSLHYAAPADGPLVSAIVGGMSKLWGEAANDIAAFVVQSWAARPPGSAKAQGGL
ncbi:hypothetical protein AcidC75_31180 [Acidisoma sp. C75]